MDEIRQINPTKKQQIALDCPCDVIIFGGSKGGGKMQPVTSLVATPFGFRELGSLKIGDIITNPVTGGMEHVLQIYEHGEKDVYKLKFVDGSSCECGLEHLWLVKKTAYTTKKRKINNLGQDGDWKVVDFAYIKNFLDSHNLQNDKHLLVPLSKPVKFTKSYKCNMRPIDPYCLGLIIGDGCISGNGKYPVFTTNDIELANAFSESGYEIRKVNSVKQNDYRIHSDEFVNGLKKLGLIGNVSSTHYIPESYKLSSIDTRKSIIQGLFDTDGTVDNRGHVSYCTTSKQLALDVQWIVRSLGGKATISKSAGKYKDKSGNQILCKMSYDVYVSIDDSKSLFRLKRKQKRCNDEFNGGLSSRNRRIVGYEYVGKKKCRCITVDDPHGLYVTDDFIVTHNSTCAYMKIIQHAHLYGQNAKILFLRKTQNELSQNIDEAKKWFFGIATWREQRRRFEFINGAMCEFAHLDRDKIDSYQGHEYTLVVYDELGNFASIREFDMMRGNMRSAHGVPCQVFATCNPGGVLHNIIKARYIDVSPAMTPVPESYDKNGNPSTWQVYIPSTILDNPYLLKNDPRYIDRLKQIGSPEMVRAWLYGDWSIVSGGAFDKLWDANIHIIKPFRIPESWRIVGVYDDGLSKPYAMCWFAISDGSDYYLINGESRKTIKGDVFVVAELYGWNGTPNVGTCESVESKAMKILAKEKALGYKISERIADSAIFSQKSHSIADEFEENGVLFYPCNKAPNTRILSINMFRNKLIGSLERCENAGIFWFDTCRQSIRTIPVLSRDKNNPDDINTKEEDHLADCCFYFCLSEEKEAVSIGAIY